MSISDMMEAQGWDPDHSDVAGLMQDQHYAASLAVGYQMMGDYDDE